jgi:hypothetical protein
MPDETGPVTRSTRRATSVAVPRASASPAPTTPNPSTPKPSTPNSPHSSAPNTPRQQSVAPQPTDTQPQPDQQSSQPKVPDLAASLALLAQKLGSISDPKPKNAAKLRNPDVFDGTDPTKIEAFVFQCLMYFSTRRNDFPDDQSRVTFALSYLKGNPLDWFQSDMTRSLEESNDMPDWMDDYPTFIAELRRLFGPRDPVTDAAQFLEALRYKDSGKATRYTIDFNRHAHRSGWNDVALARQYYKGLPDRLKDEIARIGKPTSLQPLQELVATLDQRYWERQSEISRDKRQSPATASSNQHRSSDNRSDQRADNRQSSPANTSKSSTSQPQNRNKDQKKPASSSTFSSAPAKPNPISELLGPDGKLKPEERKRRMDLNLCLRCGGTGHTVNNCPQTSKTKPKGRAATAAPSPSAPVTAGKA